MRGQILAITLTIMIMMMMMTEAGPFQPFRLDQVGFKSHGDCMNVIMMCEILFPDHVYYRNRCNRRCQPDDWPFSTGFPNQYRPRNIRKIFDQTQRAEEKEMEEIYPNFTKDGQRIFEGDMVMSEKRARSLYSKQRKAREDEEYFWPGGIIPFVIKKSSLKDKAAILKAIEHWMESTCLVFHEVPPGSIFPHLIFEKNEGCYSSVGREKYPEGASGQTVSIGPGCEGIGTIVHEIGHSIGFFHEHARPDRDRHVQILYQNIKKVFLPNFQVGGINSRGVPYDLNSVMHYKPKEFSLNGKNTIIPLDPLHHFEIGQRNELSFLDKKLANIMYRCNAHCSPVECLNEGYLDKTCACICSKFYKGERCEIAIPPPKPECGGVIKTSQEIYSPAYFKSIPGATTKCIWKIQASPGQTIRVFFEDFDINLNRQCKKESLEIRKGHSYDGDFYCGDELTGKSIVSAEPLMYLFLTMDSSEYRGFKALVTFESQKQSNVFAMDEPRDIFFF